MAMEALEVIRNAVGVDWQRMTPIVQRIKMRPAFRGYGSAVSGMYEAERAGIIEVKRERSKGVGPQTVYVRRKDA